MCMTVHLSSLILAVNPLTLKLRRQPFRGLILSQYSSILEINLINLPYETRFLKAPSSWQHPNLPNPFQIYNKKKMENFVLLKDSFDSLTFDSYDLIPTLETVYGKLKSCFYQVYEGKIEYQTHKIYSQ